MEDIKEIPLEYTTRADHLGTIEPLSYQTYDAKNNRIVKQALIYLPYGYDETKPYNIFYLMHGIKGNETTYFKETALKNVLDHAIEDKLLSPLIVVCPTFNQTSKDSFDYSLSLKLTQLFPQELVHDLLPAIETHYHTYARTIDLTGLYASRNHRGFGGFSFGSVTAWHVFDCCFDYFHYYMMLSGNYGNGTKQEQAVQSSGYDKKDFFIFAATGTKDFAQRAFEKQVMNMGNHLSAFVFADTQKEGNLCFRKKKGGTHDYNHAITYLYNGLPLFWD